MKIESIDEKLMRLAKARSKVRSQARWEGEREMKCESCYYKKLCGRGGLGFKDDGFGKCERKSYLDIDRDEAFNSIYCKRGREGYYLPKEAYDTANIGDEDAQDQSQARWHDIKPPYDDEEEIKQ